MDSTTRTSPEEDEDSEIVRQGDGNGFLRCERNHLHRLLGKRTNDRLRISCLIIGPAGQRNQEKICLTMQIVLVYSVNFHIIMQHLNNILLTFNCEILKIAQVTVNLRGASKKSCFAVYIITRNRIIWNKKNKMHLLKYMFLELTLGGFFFEFWIFRSTWNAKNGFSLMKNRLICYCKNNNY